MPLSDCTSRLICWYVYRDTVFWLHQANFAERREAPKLLGYFVYIEIPFSDCISRLMQSENGISIYTKYPNNFGASLRSAKFAWCNQKTVSLYTYQHISRLVQSESGILLLFYIFLSHGNRENNLKRGDAVSCPQAPVVKWPFTWDSQVSPHYLSFIIWFSRYRFSLYVL
jgi:hypothetical protein